MMKYVVTCLCCLLPMSASAASITVSGNFDGVNLGNPSGVDQIGGSWSLMYDDTSVMAVGFDSVTLALSSFSLTPNPLGATTFDLSNTRAFLTFINRAIISVTVGGTPINAQQLDSNADDFLAPYGSVATGSTLESLFWSLASQPGGQVAANEFDGSFTAGPSVTAPEPTTSMLLGLGVLGLVGHAWRRRKGPSEQ